MYSYSILIVDDEINVINSLTRLLRPRKNWTVETYENSKDALKRAECNIFDIVISDYKMPDMDGLEFLERLKELQPDAIRILLTGSLNPDVLINAINRAGAFRFIHKPWDNVELLKIIDEGIKYRAIMVENRIMASELKKLKAETGDK